VCPQKKIESGTPVKNLGRQKKKEGPPGEKSVGPGHPFLPLLKRRNRRNLLEAPNKEGNTPGCFNPPFFSGNLPAKNFEFKVGSSWFPN